MKKNHLFWPAFFSNFSLLLAIFNIFWIHTSGLTVISLVIPVAIVLGYLLSDVFMKAEMERHGADRHPLRVTVYLNVTGEYPTAYQIEDEVRFSFLPYHMMAQTHFGYTTYQDPDQGVFLVFEHRERTWTAYRKPKK